MALISYSQLKEVLQDFKTNIQAKFVENITFDDSIDVATNKSKNTLKQTKNNQETVVINHVVEDWGDLEHTKYAKIQNIFDKNTQVIDGKKYVIVTNGVGQLHADPDWKVGRIPCKANDTFTVVKGSKHDSIQMGVYNSNDVWIHGLTTPQTPIKGRMVYKVTIPSNLADASYFVFNMHNQSITPDEVMVFKGHLTDDQIPKEYYPNLGNYTTVIDGDKVAIEFNKDSTSLQSNTVVEAIKELANRANTGGGGTVTSVNNVQPQGGNVTIDSTNINTTATNQTVQQALDNKVETSRVGNNAGQIPQIDGTGKLVTSIMPDLAITSVRVVNEKSDAQNLVTSNSIQVGDVVVIANDNNSVHMYNGTSQATFDANFIELSLGEGTIKVINNQRPDSTGSLTLNGTQINVNGQSNTTIKEELEKCVKSVNGETPRADGNVTINAGQINGVYNSAGNLQSHLNTIKNSIDTVTSRANNNSNRIGALERKKPTIHVGEIITTFKDNGDSYTLNGVTYLYCGKANNLITSANYPELTAALGLTGVASYNLPVINDIEISYDYTRRARRKHYIVAKIS